MKEATCVERRETQQPTLNAVQILQSVQPSAKVPTSWDYGTFHQNNPVYINMVRAADPHSEPVSYSFSNCSFKGLMGG